MKATDAAAEATTELATRYLVIAVVIFGACAYVYRLMVDSKRKRELRRRLFAEARLFVDALQSERALKPVATNVILKKGENAFYYSQADLFETRAVRHYQSGSAGVKIAKGVRIGATQGHSSSTQEWTRIDSGALTVTNRRLIFDGGSQDRAIALDKVVSVNSSLEGLEVSVEGRQKSMIFSVVNPLIAATVIRICCQIEDPLDLSNANIQIAFDE